MSAGTPEYSLRIGLSSGMPLKSFYYFQGSHDPNLADLHIDVNHSISVTPKRFLHCRSM